MKIQIDLKSAACGLVVGIVAMFALGAGEPGAPGKFQISIGGNPPVFVLLDTTTGKVWMGNGMAPQLKSDQDFFNPKCKK